MYYIERIPLTDANFLAGGIGAPSFRETPWAPGVWPVGTEVVRPTLRRIFKCAVARTASDIQPPEVDKTSWAEMRFCDRWVTFGPLPRVDGKMVYESHALELTTADIDLRLKLRYCNAIGLFGMRGASWFVEVYDQPGGVLKKELTGTIKAPARGYWDYAYGQRRYRDRVLIRDLPIFPQAEVRIRITASAGQLRRLTQVEVGKLRFIPGVDWGGTDYGLVRTPRAFSFREDEDDGSSTTLLYGTTDDMSGRVHITGRQEDQALVQLRGLLGKGTAFTPTLDPGYEQSLVFGTLESAPTTRSSATRSSFDFQIRGLPTS